MFKIVAAALLVFFNLVSVALISAEDGTTVRGKFAQSDKPEHQISFDEFDMKLVQFVQLPQPKFPANWAEMKVEQRQAWAKAYQESEEGKKLIAEREKMLAERPIFDIKIDEHGKWVVFDVPPGKYGLVQGRVDKEKNGIKFAYELFGTEVEVAEEVDEIALDPIQVLVTPLLEAGLDAPNFKVATFDDKGAMTKANFGGKPTFLYFWAMDSKPSVDFHQQIQTMFAEVKAKYPLELLNVNLDAEREAAIELIKQKKIQGRHGFTGGLTHDMLDDYGVRSFPSLWLISGKGKILLTNFDFRRASATPNSSLSKIVLDAIEGKNMPTPVEAEPAKKK